MNLESIDFVKLSKLTSQQTDGITCVGCCKYYIAPETAACGHTLCHNCWRGCKSCPLCSAPVDKKQIKLNQPMHKLTEHVKILGAAYEKLFNIKLDEFLLDSGEAESENDPEKNVVNWLTSSQNHFSAPPQSSDPSSQELKLNFPIKVTSSNIQVHAPTRITTSPEKVVHVSIPQDDWDKIEILPAAEVLEKNEKNVVGPMDIEPFFVDDNEYSVAHPRRSSRKREFKNNDADFNPNNSSLHEKENPKESSGEIDKKLNKSNTKQNWNNVKKMRKEFSKLNKLNRNKLNVSIEMVKKTQSTTKVNNNGLQNMNTPQVYEIDENTPMVTLDELPGIEMTKMTTLDHKDKVKSSYPKETVEDSLHNSKCNAKNIHKLPDHISCNMSQPLLDSDKHVSMLNQDKENRGADKENPVKMPFYKKSALCTSDLAKLGQANEESHPPKTVNHNIESKSNTNEDIEITIKVGNTITNIVIKKKNDVQLKVYTDREVQTSLCSQDEGTSTPQKIETRNVLINIDSNNEVNIEHTQILHENRTEALKIKQASFQKSASAKKNTASADTGTGQFEITESVEKELSDIMECAEIVDQQKAKSAPTISEITQKVLPKSISNPENSQRVKTPTSRLEKVHGKNTPKSQHKNTPDLIEQEALECLNDMDIFESDTVKETKVQQLKCTKNTAPSEILISTAHTRNKTQKSEKRDRGDANEELQTSKKQKLNDGSINIGNSGDMSKQRIQIQPDSEPMNYDSIMGQVFARIDADMEEIKSQNVESQKSLDKTVISHEQKQDMTVRSQSKNVDLLKQSESEVYENEMESTSNNELDRPKDSENIFSVCIEREDVIEASAPKNDQAPDLDPPPNAEDFLTPVLCSNRGSSSVTIVESQVIEINTNDSESVVEDTPQKDTSFVKLKPKSITNQNSSQRLNSIESRVPRATESDSKVVSLVDSTGMHSANDVTVIQTARKTLETPLTINKFVNHIQHNSTPVARKSLNFEAEDDIDPEQTLCPTSDVAKTTQEKEFLRKAFERTPTTQVFKPLGRGKTFCLAGSCLSSDEVTKLRVLCAQYKWSYVDRFTKDLTHLVVGVDEENKSQRSVKYMCALAASKWIVTSEWVERCLKTKTIVGEEKYEALDSTGEPGPRRSRVAHKKLFQGITFYCMEPFSVLDVDTLKEMLELSGGRVVREAREVRVADHSAPALLLAEPENTQEDRFIYLAMELSIVPVNYEWVLNCLGSYTISSVQELLLCPSSLLPKATEGWPYELIAREDD